MRCMICCQNFMGKKNPQKHLPCCSPDVGIKNPSSCFHEQFKHVALQHKTTPPPSP